MSSDNELIVTIWADDAMTFTVNDIYDETSPTVVVALFVGCIAKTIFRMFTSFQ